VYIYTNFTSRLPVVDGWSILPDGTHIKAGKGVFKGHNVTLGDYIIIEDDARLCSCSTVQNKAHIGCGALIGRYSTIGPCAIVGDNVCIHDHVKIEPRANIQHTPIYIHGSRCGISYVGNRCVQIGSSVYPIDWWTTHWQAEMAKQRFTSQQSQEYQNHLNSILKWMNIYDQPSTYPSTITDGINAFRQRNHTAQSFEPATKCQF